MCLYRAFGLNIQSEIELAHMCQGDGYPDLCFRFGETPQYLENISALGAAFQRNDRQYLFYVNGIARFLVQNGDEIIIDPAPNADMARVRLFLLAYPLGALLHQRDYFLLHGSAIQTEQGTIAFIGDSGAGKSTLVAEFVHRGYQLVSDEFCAMTAHESGTILVHPANPYVRLWRDSIEHLGKTVSGLQRVYPDMEKYYLPCEEQLSPIASRLDAVFVIETHDQPEIRHSVLNHLQGIPALHEHIYLQQSMAGQSFTPQTLTKLAQISSQIRMFRVQRPQDAPNRLALFEHILMLI